jgi:ABC-type glycerol-3-phosphate transport system substrate-binding protein
MTMNRYATCVLTLATAVLLTACGGGGIGGTGLDAGSKQDDPTIPVETSTTVPLPLPSGHGLAAGAIRVAPGTSAVHGNVLVSCPPGGPMAFG